MDHRTDNAAAEGFSLRDDGRSREDLLKTLSDRERLMDASDVCIVKIRLADFTLVEYNDAVCRMIGCSREEFEKRFHHRMAEYYAGDGRAALETLKKAVAEALDAGKSSLSLGMLPMLSAKGNAWIGGTASFTEPDPETKRPEFMYAVYHDVTEIVDTQKKLAAAEIELHKKDALEKQVLSMRHMIDGVPSGLGALRVVGGVPDARMQFNRHFCERVDLAPDENNTVGFLEFPACLHPDDREKCRADFHEFLQAKEFGPKQYRFRSKNGDYYWGEACGSIVSDSDDAQIAYFSFTNVNEAKLAEDKLRESQQIYQSTVDTMQLAMWTYDIPARRIVLGENSATLALRKKFGWPAVFENAPESSLYTVDEADRGNYLRTFREIEAGRDTSCEVWYQRQAGLEPYCERESYHVVRDGAGKPVLAYGVGQNVTAEKRVEERYRREMDYLRHNSSESLIAKGHYNLSRNLVLEYETSVKQKGVHIQPGISYDEAYAGMLRSSFSDADRAEIADKLSRKNLIRLYQQGQAQTSLQYCRTVEGQDPIWVSMTVHIHMMPETGDLELFSYAYDISAHRLIENVMDTIFLEAFDYIGLIYAQTGQFEFLKKSDKILFPEVQQRTPYADCCGYVRKNFVSEDERTQFDSATALGNILAGLHENARHTATYLRSESGGTSCKQLDYVWLNQAENVILVTRADVTAAYERDQRQMRKIQAAKLEADRANEAKSTFLSGMSHDLRTPLNGVLGFTSFALKENDPQKKQKYLEKIDASGKLLLDLVNDTLELSRIESGKAVLEPEAVLPGDLIPAVVTALRPSAELKGLRLNASFEIDASVPVWCDKLKVQKIALNLLSNAIKYTPEGGTVSVSLKPLPSDEPGRGIRLIVADTGIGMSEEFMRRMFEPFSQEKRSETVRIPGTGLGLSIVKRYVDLMGGRIEVESRLYQGTRWVVFLPVCPVRDGQTKKPTAPETRCNLAGKRVLLCEDNYMNTEIAVMLLQNQGVLVETAEDGGKGLDMFTASAAGYYDAVLMDIRMPVMDGCETTRRIRAADRPDAKTVPIIAMTADAFEESVRKAKKAGMNEYVTKPLDPNRLYQALDSCTRG